MTGLRSRALGAAALIALSIGSAWSDEAASGLQPYQMVRSLQLVQDRIAGGDHAALPMQKKLLEMIDGRFQSSGREEFADRRNFDALLVYAMSGGNPATVAGLMRRIELPDMERRLGSGVLGYLTGDMAQARSAMSTVDPEAQQPELGAFLSLIKGSVAALEDAKAGIATLDRARLLGPGTLVEEAALRRTISLAVSSSDAEVFLSASEQYARRFLRSPYASQFAEAFVSGIIELKRLDLDLARIEQTIAWMTQEQAKTVYLRLARRAAIDGDAALLDFASSRAKSYDEESPTVHTARSELYSSISSVTSETVQEVLAKLEDLDATQLSQADRALLDAARSVAAEVIAPVDGRAMSRPIRVPDAENMQADAEAPAEEADETDNIVASARAKLDAIDKMLEEQSQ